MNETIVAVSTAPGEGGIGIVRLSGDRAEEILARLYESKRGAREETGLRVCNGEEVREDRLEFGELDSRDRKSTRLNSSH